MDFYHDKSWDNLQKVFSAQLPITEAWNKIIDSLEQTSSKPYWHRLREVDLVKEQDEIKEWLEHLVVETPILDNVVALWIGICKMEVNGEVRQTIYISGANTYNEESIEWANEPTYLPENRYACPEVLHQVDKIVRTDEENYEFFDWFLPLAYCALTLDEIIRTKLDSKVFLKNGGALFVTVGHDGGDYLEISNIE